VNLENPSSPPVEGLSDAEDQESVLVDRYWEELLRGDTPDPGEWLEAHARGSVNLRDQRELLKMVHRSRERKKDRGVAPESRAVSAEPEPPQVSPPSLPVPTWLGGGTLCILGSLGAGGMGEVYLAWDETMQDQVAVKLTGDPELRARFRRERAIHHRLGGHQYVALVRHGGQHEGRDYLVMEYIPGVDLQNLVKTKGPLHWREACRLIRQAAMGLEHAHAHDIVHRDMKPGNLMRSARNHNIKILDWGLARGTGPASAGEDEGMTHSGCRLGTDEFMSPEQSSSPSTVGPSSDLYSLGCTFYYLLTGKSPKGDQPEPRRSAPELPPELEVPTAVEQMLQKLMRYEPAARYQSAHELVQALDGILGTDPDKLPVRRPRRRGGWRWVAAALVLVGAVVLSAVWPLFNRSLGFKGPAQQLAEARLGSPPPKAQTIEGPETKAFSAPRLNQLAIDFQRPREADEKKKRKRVHLMAEGRLETSDLPAPLGPEDSFVIQALFDGPTYSYIVWVDTAGFTTVKASPDRRPNLRYPPGGPKEVAWLDPKDPPGTHVILLAAGTLPPDRADGRIATLLKGIGKPPDSQSGMSWHYDLTGARVNQNDSVKTRSPQTKRLSDNEVWLLHYMEDIQRRLDGPEFQTLHAILIRGER